jgi:hypothetical protein
MDSNIGNELIATALGYVKTNVGWTSDNTTVDKSELEFHSDWNDLMHVVDWCFKQKADYQDQKAIEDALISADSVNRKHNVWIACIHLIQHKNK